MLCAALSICARFSRGVCCCCHCRTQHLQGNSGSSGMSICIFTGNNQSPSSKVVIVTLSSVVYKCTFSYTLTLNVKFFPLSDEKWCLSLYRFFFHFLFGSSCLLTYWKFKYFSFMTSVFIYFDGFYAEWIVFSVCQRASLSSQDYKNILCIFLVFLYIFSLCYLTIRNILLVWHAFKILTFFPNEWPYTF